MKKISKKVIGCDVCDKLLLEEHGVLKAKWGKHSQHTDEKYEIFLCEACFFGALAHLISQREMIHLFDDSTDFSKLDNSRKIE
ncbi:TPA: hypothetical protein ACHKB2_001559 [Acinetobacter baumannii]